MKSGLDVNAAFGQFIVMAALAILLASKRDWADD
jgi:hypothetical protein